MATVNWAAPQQALAGAGGLLSATLTAINDVTSWAPMSGPFLMTMHGASATTVQLYIARLPDQSDAVLVDSQTETERAARYDMLGTYSLQAKLTALTAGPVDVYISR